MYESTCLKRKLSASHSALINDDIEDFKRRRSSSDSLESSVISVENNDQYECNENTLTQTVTLERRIHFSGRYDKKIFDLNAPPALVNINNTALHERVQHLLVSTMPNTLLTLESNGVRIFDEQELDRLVDSLDAINSDEDTISSNDSTSDDAYVLAAARYAASNELGLITLLSLEESQKINLVKLAPKALVQKAERLFDDNTINVLSHEELAEAVSQRCCDDIRRAKSKRKENLVKELVVRGLSGIGSRSILVQRLRKQLRIEKRIHESERFAVEFAMKNISSHENLFEMYNSLRKDKICAQLAAVRIPASHTTALSTLEFRLALYHHLDERVQLSKMMLQPHELTHTQLQKELEKRRLLHPEVFCNDENRSQDIARLEKALLDEGVRAPVRIPFGLRRLSQHDVCRLDTFELLMLIQFYDIDIADIDLMMGYDRNELQLRVLEGMRKQHVKQLRDVIREHLMKSEFVSEYDLDLTTSSDDDDDDDDEDDDDGEDGERRLLALFNRLQGILLRRFEGNISRLHHECCRA